MNYLSFFTTKQLEEFLLLDECSTSKTITGSDFEEIHIELKKYQYVFSLSVLTQTIGKGQIYGGTDYIEYKHIKEELFDRKVKELLTNE